MWQSLRSVRVRLALVVLVAVATIVPLASGASAKVDATGVVAGSGTDYTITVTNTGDQSIICMQFFPNGANVVEASGPGSIRTFGGGFGAQGFVLLRGDTAKWTFSTDKALALSAGGKLHVSGDCANDTVIDAVGPLPPPCKCSKVDAFLNNFHIFGAGTTRIEFDVKWQITCTPGQGSGCKGKVNVLAPRGADFLTQGGKTLRPAHPKIVAVNCAGPCNATTGGKETLQYVAFQTFKDKKGKVRTRPNPRFLPQGRANKAFTIKVGLICISPDGVPGFPTTKTLTLKFDRLGQVDYKKSDLNGDGKADGRQLKQP
jgi:hypothetical protein